MTAAREIERRIAWLSAELNRHLRLYHQEDAPEISDAEYDALFRELAGARGRAPRAGAPDSPTQRVGAPPAEGFAEFVHRVPMLSLDNAMSEDELRAFDERVRRVLEREEPLEYFVEPKLDGASVELVYEDGALCGGRDARRRARRRGRHREPARLAERSARAGRRGAAGASRCAARWCCPRRASSG